MGNTDLVIIASSETVDYEKFSQLPLERIDVFRDLVQLRMVYFEEGFRSVFDIFNKIIYKKFFFEADYGEKKTMFSIWNLPALNAILAINPLTHEGFTCKIINNFDADFDLLLSATQSMDTPIISISTTFILQWSEVGRICKKIHKQIPDAVIILGGAFVHDQFLTNDVQMFERPMRKYRIQYTLFNYNSERDLLDLIRCLKNNGSPRDVKNLAYLDSQNTFVTTEKNWNPPELDTIPVHWEQIIQTPSSKTLQIRTSVGCPFRCAFCNYSTIARTYSLSSLAQVKNQIEAIAKFGRVEALVFIDDNLNVPHGRFRELLTILKEFDFRWYGFLRVQFVDEMIASDMKESGCDGVYLGLESGCDDVLKTMNKKATVQAYQNGIDHLKEEDIKTSASFILGFPGESPRTIQKTTEFIENSGLDFYSLKEWYYLKSSSVHAQKEKFNLEGEGHTWKHDTMTSHEASNYKLSVFESVKKPIHIDPDMGLWGPIYLRDRGYSWEQILTALRIVNEMISRDIKEKWTEKYDKIRELEQTILHKAY